MSEQEDGFIGSRLKLIPPSRLVHSTPAQLLLLAKRQLIRLDISTQTLAYAPLDDSRILHATYHPLLSVYLLLTEKSLLAVNQAGELIASMVIEGLQGAKFVFMVALQDGYRGVPNNRQDVLVYGKGDHLYSCRTSVFNERQMIKNKSICDLALTLHAPTLHESPQFIERQKHLPDCSLLILWDNNETYLYRTPSLLGQPLQRIHIYSKISKRENQSLDYAVSPHLKLMAVAFESGVVKVFYLDHSKKYLGDLKGHQAACTTLFIPAANPHLLYSCGLDSTVRVWNLKDYEQVYVLQLDLLVRESRFIGEGVLFLRSQQLKEKSYLCELNTNQLEPIVNDNLSGQLLRMRCDAEWCVSIYSNNLVEFFSPNNHALSNQKLQYPLQYGAVVDVFHLGGGWYVVALQKGFSVIQFNKQEIKAENFELKKLVYNESILRRKQDSHEFIELIHEKLLGTYLFNAISDWKNIPSAVTVTHVYFHRNTRLPFWEGTNYRRTEAGQRNNEGSLPTRKHQQTSNESVYCVIGTAKGEIMFVDITNRSHYSTKVQFHTSPVEFIREVKLASQKMSACFVSLSADRQICIWGLSHKEPPLVLVSVYHNKEISFLEVYESYMVVGEKDGEFSILGLELGERELKACKANSTGGHLRAVICGDYMRYSNQELFLSGGEDSVIKIWRGVQKELLFQLKLFGIVTAINFLHQHLNLIVCHNEQISVIREDKLRSLKKAEKLLETPSKADNLEEISWRQFFFREPHSPVSPYRRSQMHKSNTRYFQISRRPTRIEELEQNVVVEKQPLEGASRVMMTKPLSEPRLQLADKKVRRFHLFTASKEGEVQQEKQKGENQLNFMLPSINIKAKVAKPTNPRLKGSQFFATREQKSFSTAARHKF